MSESTTTPQNASTESAADSASPSAGAQLRQIREAAGLHIAALAVSLKVPVKKLEALEGDRLDLLPDTVFARALAASVCRILKADPRPILEKLPLAHQKFPSPLQDGIGGGVALNESSGNGVGHPSLTKPFAKLFAYAGAALLVAALSLLFFSTSEQPGKTLVGDLSPASPSVAPPALSQPTTSGTSSPVRVDQAALDVQTAPSVAAAPGAQTASPSPLLVPNLNASNLMATPAAGSTPNLLPPTGLDARQGLLVIKTRGPSWVEVKDATGLVHVRKVIDSGEVVDVTGMLPLSVIVGRVDTTDVQIRGKNLDLAPVSKDNVARFEVR